MTGLLDDSVDKSMFSMIERELIELLVAVQLLRAGCCKIDRLFFSLYYIFYNDLDEIPMNERDASEILLREIEKRCDKRRN